MPTSPSIRNIPNDRQARIAPLAREIALAEMEYLIEVIRNAAPFSTEWCSAHEAAMDVQSKLDDLEAVNSAT